MSEVRAAPAGAIALRGVDKTYANGTRAIDGVSLEIAAGSFVSVLGPSGCGKSTLLRMIAGLIVPTDGRIETGARGREIGFVFQEPTLLPWATAEANVALPLRLMGVDAADRRERARQMLARVGLEGFEGAWPRELSGGMKMRVSIARALVDRPRVLLLDEPFAALDEIARHRLNADLLDLWRETGVTVVFVTHSVFESAFLSQRIVVMSARPGRIVADLAVDTDQTRDEAFRTSPAYGATCRRVSDALREAMAA